MSSVTNCHNHSLSAALSQSDNDEENAFDSSYNRQNESMMHKVKDVVSKFLHPSFLFSNNDDTTRPKRKRSISVEEHDDEQQTTTNVSTIRSKSKYDRSVIKDDEPEITDDEDNNSRDVPSTKQDLTELEQQKKRRRTANYQHILSTKTSNSHHNDERTSSPLTLTDSIRSLSNIRINQTSNTTPIRGQTSIEQNYNERINRLTASKQRFDILPTYRGSTSNYDPSKSPLFSAGTRKPTSEATTTTNLKSNEFSANYLLASSLANRPESSSSLNRQQSPATLTKPITNNNTNRLLSNERQMLGVNYASINSRRLPYIERLRRRTLEDCIRLNQTTDNEPLSRTIIKEHKSTTASPEPKRTRAPEKECGIQCDILTVESPTEPNKKSQRTFPPADIRDEALSVPTTEKSQTDSFIQTDSSITIEKIQSSAPVFNITKPKVLGNITPFSWPKFARAQDDYAKKYPEKCRSDAVVPSTIQKSNVNIIPAVSQQTNTSASTNTISKLLIFPFTPSRPTEAIWKCPSCTKEHPAQTASCSLCHGINPNYKKLSAVEAAKTIEKQPVLSNKLPDVIAKEPSIPTPSITNNTNQTIPTTTKENILSVPPAGTTSATSTTFPSFGVTSVISTPVTTKENLTAITAPITTSSAATPLFFGVTPVVSSTTAATSQQNPISTSISRPMFGTTPLASLSATTTQDNPVSTGVSGPMFAVTPIVSPPTTTTAQDNPISTGASRPMFGVAPIVSPPTTQENSLVSSVPPMFGTTTTMKENPITSSIPPMFGIVTTTTANPVVTSTAPLFGSTTFDKTSNQFSTAFPPFVPPTLPSVSTVVTSSTVPSITTVPSTTSTSSPFGTFGTTPINPTTTATPIVSTVSFSQLPAFTLPTSASAPSLLTSIAAPVVTSATSSFPAPSTTSTFTSPNTLSFASTATTSASSAFSSSGFNFPSASTTTITSSNPPFRFGAVSSTRPSAPTIVSPMNTTSGSSFGTIAPLGTAIPFGTTTTFGTTTPFGTVSTQADRPPSSVPSFLPTGTSNTPSTFGFGSTSNPTQTSTALAVSTGGFAFGSSTSPASAPVFGASPTPLAAPFGFAATSTASPNNALFQFSGSPSTPMVNNPFSTPVASNSTIDESNPFSIGSNESTAVSNRQIIKAKRRRP